MVTEQDIEKYLSQKEKIVVALEKKWREMSHASLARAVQCLPVTETLVCEMDDLDREFARAGGFDSVDKCDAAITASADPSVTSARESLHAAMNRAHDALMLAKTRLGAMKDDLGRRLSELKFQSHPDRHGAFDRKV